MQSAGYDLNKPVVMEERMKSLISAASALCILASCGSTVTNTDKPTGIYIAGASTVTGDFSVNVVETKPQAGGAEVSGVSCKNKFWEPAPSNDVAISVLKREVRKAGFENVYIVSVEPDPNALLKNCWSAIIARGIAF